MDSLRFTSARPVAAPAALGRDDDDDSSASSGESEVDIAAAPPPKKKWAARPMQPVWGKATARPSAQALRVQPNVVRQPTARIEAPPLPPTDAPRQQSTVERDRAILARKESAQRKRVEALGALLDRREQVLLLAARQGLARVRIHRDTAEDGGQDREEGREDGESRGLGGGHREAANPEGRV